MNVPDIIRTIANFLPDIRILRLNRTLDAIIREHPEYAIWEKCAQLCDIYRYGTVNMLGAFSLRIDYIKFAALGGNAAVVQYLISAGADLSNGNIFENACLSRNSDTIQLLYCTCESELNADEMLTAFGCMDIMQFLFKRGVGRDVMSTIVMAVLDDRVDAIKYLVENLEISRDEQNFALRNACFYGAINTVKFLVSVGIVPDERAFCLACYRPAVFQILADTGVQITQEVVATACVSANREVLEIIRPDDSGLQLASKSGNLQAVKYFVSRGTNARNSVWYAIIGWMYDPTFGGNYFGTIRYLLLGD